MNVLLLMSLSWMKKEKDMDKNKQMFSAYCLGIKKPSANYLEIKKSSPNWFGIVPEVTNRQIGNSPLFQRRFHGSLLAMERLEFMYSLNDKVNSSPCKCIELYTMGKYVV